MSVTAAVKLVVVLAVLVDASAQQSYVSFDSCNFETTSSSSTLRTVKFRICDTSDCSTAGSSSCGLFELPLEQYTSIITSFHMENDKQMCDASQSCQTPEGLEDSVMLERFGYGCEESEFICEKIQNMNDNGYMEAAEFISCKEMYRGNDENNNNIVVYAAAICASSGHKIKIGGFLEKDCSHFNPSVNVDNYLFDPNGYRMKLSYATLKKSFRANMCTPCQLARWDSSSDDNDGMCDELLHNALVLNGDNR